MTATASGGSVQLASKATGSTTDYAVSVSVTDTEKAQYPSLFPSASFAASATSLTGGQNLSSSYGTVYSYAVPAGGYAANGNLLSYTDSTVMGTWNFQYDTLGRLASASSTPASGQPANPYPDYCWSYDSFGNRTAQMSANVLFASTQGGASGCSTSGSLGQNVWAQYNGTINGTNNNQLSATSLNPNQGQSSGYDQAGDILYDGANKYLYDGEGRQCAVETGGSGGPVTGYLYNAEGLRVIKGSMSSFACPNSAASFTAINEQYLLDSAGNQVTELNGSGGWTHTNFWDGEALDATYDNKGLHFHLKDPLGTRRVQLAAGSNLVNNVSTAGMVEEYCLSEPYGDALNCYNPPGAPPTADDATEHHFTGKERDAESGNDYFGARYFTSTMGRFMSPDWSAKVTPVPYAKLGDPQTLNLYAYVGNNPLTRRDLDGHVVALTCAAGTSSSQCSQDKGTELQRLAANASKTDKNGLSESSLFKPTTDKNGNTTMTLDKKAAANFKGEHSAGYNLLTGAIDAKQTISVEMSNHDSFTGIPDARGNMTVNLDRNQSGIDLVSPLRGTNGQQISNPFQIIAGHEVLGHAYASDILGLTRGMTPAQEEIWVRQNVENTLRQEQGLPVRDPNSN